MPRWPQRLRPRRRAGRDHCNWVVVDPDKGANRYALSLAVNYALTTNATLKFEYRYDAANLSVFQYTNDGSYKKSNQLLGGSVVVSF